MNEWLRTLAPNVADKPDIFMRSVLETLAMLGISGSISFALGLALGVIITATKRGGVLQNTAVFSVLDKSINALRSVPFIILLAGLIPLTRLIVGTAIGVKGAIVPLVFGTVPFFARQVESALAEVPAGVIEAAQSMGVPPVMIIFRVYLKESVAALSRATSITAVSLIGLTAMAGAVGAGGLGDFAIRYGHQRNQTDVTYVTVIALVALVSAIQLIGGIIAKKNTH